jgi:hypothetical protein
VQGWKGSLAWYVCNAMGFAVAVAAKGPITRFLQSGAWPQPFSEWGTSASRDAFFTEVSPRLRDVKSEE